MRKLRTLVAAMSLAAAVGCGGASEEKPVETATPPAGDAGQRRIWVSFDLADGSTSSPIPRLLVSGNALTAFEVEGVAKAASLRTWPELQPIGFTYSVTIGADKTTANVALMPAFKLAERWYAVHVAALPSGTAWSPAVSATTVASSEAKALRFTPASMPGLVEVVTCEKEAGRYSVSAIYSEALDLRSAPPTVSLLEAASGLKMSSCALVSSGPTSTELVTVCDSLDSTRTLRLSVAAANAVSGASVPPQTVEFTPASLPKSSDGCGHFRPATSG